MSLHVVPRNCGQFSPIFAIADWCQTPITPGQHHLFTIIYSAGITACSKDRRRRIIIITLTGQDYTYTFPLVMLKDGVVAPLSVSNSVEEYPFGGQGLKR